MARALASLSRPAARAALGSARGHVPLRGPCRSLAQGLNMARRSVSQISTGQEARDAIARAFQRHTRKSGVNLAEFEAQKYAVEMVEGLVGLSRDFSVPAALRRECMKDVYEIAFGKIREYQHPGVVIDPNAPGVNGPTIADDMEIARETADLHTRMNDLVMRNVPLSQWPEDVRLAGGNMIQGMIEAEEAEAADDPSKAPEINDPK